MALQFNSYMKGASGIPLALYTEMSARYNRLYIYPSSVSYPSTCPTSVTAGSILTYGNSVAFTWIQNGATISLQGSQAVSASAAGTLSWWLMTSSTNAAQYGLCGDSISAPGGGGVVIVSTLTPTLNQSVTLSAFSITLT